MQHLFCPAGPGWSIIVASSKDRFSPLVMLQQVPNARFYPPEMCEPQKTRSSTVTGDKRYPANRLVMMQIAKQINPEQVRLHTLPTKKRLIPY
jgi:hypothetical protein